jgi:hypothetical protein
MPLSDRERALLAEMEQALSADDPRLSSTLTGAGLSGVARKPKVLAGVSALLGGLVVLFIGLVGQLIPVGIAGFAIGLGGLVTLIQAASGPSTAIKVGKVSARKGRGFGSRLEERWDRRNNQ